MNSFNPLILTRVVPQRDVKSTIAMLILLIIVGSLLVWQMINLRKTLEEIECPIYSTVKGLANTLFILAILMIIAPILLLMFNFAGFKIDQFKKFSIAENFVKTQAIVTAFSLVIIALIYILHIKLQECQMKIEIPTWIAGGLLIVGSLSLLFIRLFEDAKYAKQIREEAENQSLFQKAATGLSRISTNVTSAIGSIANRINPF